MHPSVNSDRKPELSYYPALAAFDTKVGQKIEIPGVAVGYSNGVYTVCSFGAVACIVACIVACVVACPLACFRPPFSFS